MRKSTTLRFILASLLAVCLGFVCACSDSENADGSSSAVVGRKYITQDYSFGEGSNDHAWMNRETTILYFYDGENGVSYYSLKDVDTDLGTSRQTDWEFFTYKVSGNKVVIKESGSTYSLIISGSNLTSSGGDLYKGSDMVASDYDLVNSLKPQTGKCGDKLTYSYNKKGYTLTIKGSGDMYDYTSSNQPWHGLYISSVVIEEGVTSIGNNAFNGFKITSIDVPETLKRIGDFALSGTFISSLPLPDSLEEIGSYAFSDCPAEYTYLTLPKNLKKIGDWAFADIAISKTLTLNEKLETIGNGVFTGVKGTLTIPNSVKSIGSLAFSGTFNKIIIGTGLESLSKVAFSAASSGTMYVNLGNPLTVEDGILAGDSKAESKWTLYVPKGSKTAYAKKAPWSYFKAIYEDSSLESGNGEPEESGTEEDKTTGKKQGYTWVNLGLPSGTKWATCNVGGSSPTDIGNYYAWGQISSEKDIPCIYGWMPDNICGNNKYDAATCAWGSAWKTPSKQQAHELCTYCSFASTKIDGKTVIKVTSKRNKACIYLPLTGYKKGEIEKEDGDITLTSYDTASPYFMIGEITEHDGSNAKNYRFNCTVGYATCDVSFNLTSWITYWSHNSTYKLPIRPVTN